MFRSRLQVLCWRFWKTMTLGMLGICLMFAAVLHPHSVHATEIRGNHENLRLARIYLSAGDYRRAILACQQEINESPSVESYVYLTYVYHATDGYLEWLASKDKWNTIGQLALSFSTRGMYDLVDPPDMLARMAKELLHEGLRQQFDLTASMANRLDKATVDRLWQEKAVWQKENPESWWAGVPGTWKW